ncbi:MAG: glycosyltransferase family 4 protein [Gallionellaceae bacterium]|nr:glycosyltransferase family 4 protein [Gallionellaceae bacterium]
MKIALSTIGKFHTFDLARELVVRDALAGIFTGYPRFKLRGEGLSQNLIHTFPWLHGSYMAFPWKQHLPYPVLQQWEYLSAVSFGDWVARSLPECDLYVGLSGSALSAGKRAKQNGARYVCDRGSSHIRYQDQLLREEHERWGMPFCGIDSRTIAREEAEYEEADCITVPSGFVRDSFIGQGIPAEKMRLLPYGVNLSRFHPVGQPADGRFDILFAGGMSLRKGVQYLVQAYQRISHPAKSLTFVGAPSQELIVLLAAYGWWTSDIRVLGHMPQSELKSLMSRSHVLVLPSIEEGLAMVQAQAMACACPVIASRNTGSEDLFNDGCEGYIVPIRDADALAARLQHLADHPAERADMAQRAVQRVHGIGGWRDYGDNAMAIYGEVTRK